MQQPQCQTGLALAREIALSSGGGPRFRAHAQTWLSKLPLGPAGMNSFSAASPAGSTHCHALELFDQLSMPTRDHVNQAPRQIAGTSQHPISTATQEEPNTLRDGCRGAWDSASNDQNKAQAQSTVHVAGGVLGVKRHHDPEKDIIESPRDLRVELVVPGAGLDDRGLAGPRVELCGVDVDPPAVHRGEDSAAGSTCGRLERAGLDAGLEAARPLGLARGVGPEIAAAGRLVAGLGAAGRGLAAVGQLEALPSLSGGRVLVAVQRGPAAVLLEDGPTPALSPQMWWTQPHSTAESPTISTTGGAS